VALAREPGQPFQGVLADRVEHPGGVPVAEVPAPAAQELIKLLHDPFVGQQQPFPVSDLTDPVTGMLCRLARWPAGKETDPAWLDLALSAYPPVVKSEEIKSLGVLALGQVHDPGLGLLQLQAQPGQHQPQPLERGLGLLPGKAHHDQVSGQHLQGLFRPETQGRNRLPGKPSCPWEMSKAL